MGGHRARRRSRRRLAVLRGAAIAARRDALTDRAAALTFFGVLAVFPGLLVVVSALGLAGPATVDSVLSTIAPLVPSGVTSFLRAMVGQVQGHRSAGLAAGSGAAVALWAASGYVAAFMRASNAIYDVAEGRSWRRRTAVRVAVTVVVAVLVVATALLVVVTGPVADQVGHAVGLGGAAVTAWDLVKWPVLLVVVSQIFSLLYWACPGVAQPRFRLVTAGGVLATGVWVVASAGFGVWVAYSGSYNRTYGSFAAVIISLMWLWLSNLALLLGAELNAEIQRQAPVGNLPGQG